MNRILVTALLGTALVAIALVGEFGSVARTADASGATVKVAVIDLERTLYETPAGKKADKKFTKLRQQKQGELDTKQKELQKVAAELDKQAAVMKPEKVKEKRAELEQKFVELQQLYVKLEKVLATERAKLIQELLKQASPYIEEIAKAEGVHVIIDASAVVWAAKAVDLTDALNKKMK